MTQQDRPPTSTLNSLSNPSSPLSQVDPKSLDLYFATDPNELTDAQIAVIVERLEADRMKFMASPDAGAEPTKSRSAANLSKKVELPTDVSTDDLLGKIGL
jgi:hypothetical protein